MAYDRSALLKGGLLLNVGCGDHPAAGWVNLDLHRDGPLPDLVGDVRGLPLPDGSCGAVYCGHVMEHLYPAEIGDALDEIRRVLRPGGLLLVVGPDYGRAVAMGDAEGQRAIIGDEGRWRGDQHRWLSSEGKMLGFLRAARYAAEPLPIGDVPAPWPVVSRVGWQFALRCRP